MLNISFIITLVLILAIIIACLVAVHIIRQKIRNFSSQVFGTEDIGQAAEALKQEYATTPKSVSAMTSLMLPRITKDFPDFQYDEMKERAINALTGYLQSINSNDTCHLTENVGAEIKEQLQQHLQMLSSQGQREHFEQIKIHRTEISQYQNTKGRCVITFQSSLGCYHYVTEHGAVVNGSKEYQYQTRYNVDLLYVQDRDLVENQQEHALGVNCPNCGAPITSLGAKTCEYCGSPVIELNLHAWTFCNIEEKL